MSSAVNKKYRFVSPPISSLGSWSPCICLSYTLKNALFILTILFRRYIITGLWEIRIMICCTRIWIKVNQNGFLVVSSTLNWNFFLHFIDVRVYSCSKKLTKKSKEIEKIVCFLVICFDCLLHIDQKSAISLWVCVWLPNLWSSPNPQKAYVHYFCFKHWFLVTLFLSL
jgi:hypothetical protein